MVTGFLEGSIAKRTAPYCSCALWAGPSRSRNGECSRWSLPPRANWRSRSTRWSRRWVPGWTGRVRRRGGVVMASQAIALARNPREVLAIPGRLLNHVQNTKGFHLWQLKYLVLDEAERMLSMLGRVRAALACVCCRVVHARVTLVGDLCDPLVGMVVGLAVPISSVVGTAFAGQLAVKPICIVG